MFPPTLTTDRLRLRPRRLDDADAMFARYCADEQVTRFLSWPTHQSIEETREYLALCAQTADDDAHHWAICLANDSLPSGGITAWARGHAVELGYVIRRSLWGRGLATEAAQAVIEAAWRVPSVWRVHAHAHVANVASRRVLEKCGLRPEGIARRAMALPQLGSVPQDAMHYAQVRDDLTR